MLLVWPPSGGRLLRALRRAGPVGRNRVARRHRRGECRVTDQAAPGRGERRVEQPGQRHADVAGVADVGVAVGVGQARRLQVVEQGGHPGLGGQVVPAQDVQRLAHGGPAARRRRHAVDVQAPVAHAGRRPHLGLVGTQVAGGHDAGQLDHGLAGGQHRMVVGLDDGLAEGPVIQIGRAVAGQQPVGLGQVGIAEQGTDRQRVAVLGQQQRAAGRVGAQFGQARLGELDEVLVDPEPALGHPDGRLEVGGQALAPVQADRLGPGGHHRGHARGQRLIRGVVVVERLARLRVEEHRRRARRGAVLAAVDGHDLVRPGQVDHHEAAAAGPRDERDGHAERAGRRHRGVDCVAAVLEHVDARLAGAHVHGGDRAPRADRDRLLNGPGRSLASGPGPSWHGQDDGDQRRYGRDHWQTTHEHLRIRATCSYARC